MPVGGSEAQLERVDRVEQVLLVLLEILVVGQRKPVEDPVEGHQVPRDPGRLGAQQLCGVRVLLLRHDARAGGERIGDLAEAELLTRPEHDLRPELREVGRAGRRRREVVEHEVAVGHGVDRVLGDAPNARSWATDIRLVSKLTPASAPAPSGRSSVSFRQKPNRW